MSPDVASSPAIMLPNSETLGGSIQPPLNLIDFIAHFPNSSVSLNVHRRAQNQLKVAKLPLDMLVFLGCDESLSTRLSRD